MTPQRPLLSRFAAAAALLAGIAPQPGAAAPARAASPSPTAHVQLTPEAQQLVSWVRQSRNNRDQPFAVIDKRHARLYVFGADGRLRGGAPVLLGLAKGDDTVPGIGNKPLSQVKPEERTTPAGRFAAEHGQNMRGEHVIWVDYDAAVSMHPVLTTNPKERRLERLATPTAADNRVSYGCVNVPRAFFSEVLLKTLSTPHPVVYVLPETRPLSRTFAGFPAAPAATAPRPAGAKVAMNGNSGPR